MTKEELKKKTKKTIVATTTAASLFVNNSYDTLSDVINPDNNERVIEDFEQIRELTLREKVIKRLNSVPMFLRYLVLVPLYSLGYVLMLAINPVLGLIKNSVQDILCGVLLLLFVLAVIFIAGLFIYPDTPLKDKFNFKTVKYSALAIALIILLDKAICLNSEEYRHYSYLSRYIASLTVTVGWAVIVFFKIKKKARKTIVASTDTLQITESN